MGRSLFNGYYALRWQVLKRDNFTCQYCGQQAPNVKLEVDHVLAVEDGGDDNPENLVTSCFACNRGKSGLSIIYKKRGIKRYLTPSYIPISPQSPRRDKVLQLLSAHPEGLSTKDIARTEDISIENTYAIMSRLKRKKLIKKFDGLWLLLI